MYHCTKNTTGSGARQMHDAHTITVQLPSPASRLLRTRGSPQVLEQVALGLEELDVCTVIEDLLLLLESDVVLPVERGETPLLRDDDLLSTRELVTSTAESLDDDSTVRVLASDGDEDLATDGRQRWDKTPDELLTC